MKSEKSYIGLTMRSMSKRWSRHLTDANSGSDVHFHRALRLYGKDNWTHCIIADGIDTIEEAESLESYFIKKYDTFENGYNSTYGGKGSKGCKLSDAQKKAHSVRMKLKPPMSKESLEKSIETRRSNLPRHKWVHFDGSKEVMASFELAEKYGMSCAHANSVYMGRCPSCFGWEIDIGQEVKDRSKVDYGTVTFHHEYLISITGTVTELAKLVNTPSGNITKVLAGERKHFLGYTKLDVDPSYLVTVNNIPLIFKDIDGNTFHGTAKELKVKFNLKNFNNLSKVISGERKQFHGWYIVKSEEDVIVRGKTIGNPISKYDETSMELIGVYNSAKKAGVTVGSKDGSRIDKICRNHGGGYLYGFYWEYTNTSSGAKRQREIEDHEFKSLDASEKMYEKDALDRAAQVANITQGQNNGNV